MYQYCSSRYVFKYVHACVCWVLFTKTKIKLNHVRSVNFYEMVRRCFKTLNFFESKSKVSSHHISISKKSQICTQKLDTSKLTRDHGTNASVICVVWGNISFFNVNVFQLLCVSDNINQTLAQMVNKVSR